MLRFSNIFGSLIGGILLASVGCSEPSSYQTRAATSTTQRNLYAQFEQQARALAEAAATQATSARPPNHNVASFIHPLEPLEYWIYLAILRDDQGSRYAVQQRFARLSVAAGISEKELPHNESQWSYTHIVAVDAQFEHLERDVKKVQSFAQREALALAGADVAEKRVWVGAFESKHRPTSVCQPSIQLDSPQVSLRFGNVGAATATCDKSGAPLLMRTAEFSVLRSNAMQVEGSFVKDAQTINLKGYGWIGQGWGIPPDSSSAAVTFDQAWLMMDSQLSVQLQRSRRASGRGPRTTTGSVYNFGNAENADITPLGSDAMFIDAEQKTNNSVPVSWQLDSPDNAMTLKLSPVSAHQAPVNIPGQSWFGVVAIEGSHRGYGFVDYSLR